MLNTPSPDLSLYSGKVRVRVCGLLEKSDQLLLIKHQGLGPKGFIWSPPGGGVEFGDSAEKTLIREFAEETNLNIKVEEFLFINEFIGSKHHAIELFYRVDIVDGEVALGIDPELDFKSQILTEIEYIPFNTINGFDKDILHNIFQVLDSSKNIFDLRGLFTFRL